MASDVVRAAGAQEVARLHDLRSAAGGQRDPERLRAGLDRGDLSAIFDLDAAGRQMIAQDLLGSPLRLAALEFMPAANSAKVRVHDPPHARTHELTVLDVHAGAEERLDHARPIDDVEHRRLERRPARLVMRREPLFDDARLDAVARQFAGGETVRPDRFPRSGRRACRATSDILRPSSCTR